MDVAAGPIGLIVLVDVLDVVNILECCHDNQMDINVVVCSFEGTYLLFFFDVEDFNFVIFLAVQEGIHCFPISFL